MLTQPCYYTRIVLLIKVLENALTIENLAEWIGLRFQPYCQINYLG